MQLLTLTLHLSPMQPVRRQLQTVTPATIRILTEYQLPSSMSSTLQQKIKDTVNSAILTIQQFIKVKVPVSSVGMLAPPQIVDSALCTATNTAGNPAFTCNGAGFWPQFTGGLPTTDIKYPL